MYIQARVYPNSKKETLTELKKNVFEIRIREPAEQNRANEKVREVLAQKFSVPTSHVVIINGHKHPKKLLEIKQ